MTRASVVAVVAAALVWPVTGWASQRELDRLVRETRECMLEVGVKPYPKPERKWKGDRYDAWRLTVWRTRRDEWCRIAKESHRNVRLALSLFSDPCLTEIVRRETGGTFSVYAQNPSSGAYGLPQALPGHKMASAGLNWRTSPAVQLLWMRGYVNGRYGGSCPALAAWNRQGWY